MHVKHWWIIIICASNFIRLWNYIQLQFNICKEMGLRVKVEKKKLHEHITEAV
jgi:hypothetical protein